MIVIPTRLAWGARAILLATLAACAGLPASNTDRLSPVRDRVTDETIASDLRVLDAWQARADALARGGPDNPNAAAVEAARAWVRLARDAYERNDRSASPDTALARAVQLVEAIERGGQPSFTPAVLGAAASDRARTASSELAALVASDGNASRIPEFGATQVLLARASHPFLRAPGCVDADPAELAAASVARLRDEAARRRSLTEQARQTPIPSPTPAERVPVTPTEPPNGMPARCREVELPATVHFALDRHELSAATRTVLDGVAASLTDRGDVSVTLDGNTDARASDAYNEALSQRRANAVRDYLMTKGIDGSRLDVAVSGEQRPTVMGTSALDHARNRRVEMRYRSATGCGIRVVEQSQDLQLEPRRQPPREKDN